MRTAGPAGRCRGIDPRARRVARLAAGAAPSRSRRASSCARGVQLGIRCGADGRGLQAGVHTGRGMLTGAFDRLGVGRGAGRHSFEAYRRGADVVAFDQNAADLNDVDEIMQAMKDQGEVPESAGAEGVKGDALDLPYADGTFDCVIASEILEHVPEDDRAIAELVRVLKPGGALAITVPRWLPERVCWALSDQYHANEGGHIRIYRAHALRDKVLAHGLR